MGRSLFYWSPPGDKGGNINLSQKLANQEYTEKIKTKGARED